jgi:Fe-S-cluster containining protein
MSSKRDDETEADAALIALASLHRSIDERVAELASLHGDRLHCGLGCASCCIDDLTVYGIEAERISRAHPTLLREGTPHAKGACALLDVDGSCRVYGERPYVCRTQGLPLRWQAERAPGEVVEYRDICRLNDEGPPLEELPQEACWLIGPDEQALSMLAKRFSRTTPQRLPLRSLFDPHNQP